jgi:hypothetical protein
LASRCVCNETRTRDFLCDRVGVLTVTTIQHVTELRKLSTE